MPCALSSHTGFTKYLFVRQLGSYQLGHVLEVAVTQAQVPKHQLRGGLVVLISAEAVVTSLLVVVRIEHPVLEVVRKIYLLRGVTMSVNICFRIFRIDIIHAKTIAWLRIT